MKKIPFPRKRFMDGMFTFDARTVDSTGAFLVGELERLDPKIHMPLVDYQWSRDLPVRKDVSNADEFSSFTTTTFASPGGVDSNGISWVGKVSNAVQGMSVDSDKVATPLNAWGLELAWTVIELEQSLKLSRPIDQDKLMGMRLKWNMDMDQVAYTGDVVSGKGLINYAGVTPANVANGASASPLWSSKTAAEILKDVNEILQATWGASGYAVAPDTLLLPPTAFSALLQPCAIGGVGYESIMEYVSKNNVATRSTGKPLDINVSKWLVGAGAGATNRMVAYVKDYDFIRFPYTDLVNTAPQFQSLFQKVTYWGKIGSVEFVRPTAVGYRDGI